MSVKILAAILLSFKGNWGSLVNRWLQFEFAWTSLYLKEDKICEFFGLIFGETKFKANLVVVDFFGFEVKVGIILADDGFLIILVDFDGFGLAFGPNVAWETLAGNILVVRRAGSTVETLTGLYILMAYEVWAW